jgi:hypothetical protein
MEGLDDEDARVSALARLIASCLNDACRHPALIDVSSKHPAGPPMTLGNMRQLGVQRLIASCLNDGLQCVSPRFHSRTHDELKRSMTSMHHR